MNENIDVKKENDTYVTIRIIVGMFLLGAAIFETILSVINLRENGISTPFGVTLAIAIMEYSLSGLVFGQVAKIILAAINSYEYTEDEEEK